MKYEIYDPAILTVAVGKSNAGKQYLQFTAVNTQAPLEVPGVVCIFNERTIELYKPFIPQAKGGTATGPVEMPDTFKCINGRFETFVFPIPAMRRYSQITTTKDGKTHQPGEIVMNGNTPRIYKSVQVFTMRQIDSDTGEPSYLRGWDCDTRGQQMFNSFYEPIKIEHDEANPAPAAQAPAQPTNPFGAAGAF